MIFPERKAAVLETSFLGIAAKKNGSIQAYHFFSSEVAAPRKCISLLVRIACNLFSFENSV
jgi:hypothetical protein